MASILPNAVAQFVDNNGTPLVGGFVYFYIPNTSTFKNTYQDPAQTILNTNPVVLDSRGEAIIWGSGSYRQVLTDSLGNVIWDRVTQDANAGLVGSMTDAIYVAGTDFTPGTTTTLTLPAGPGSQPNTWVYFDAAFQGDDKYTVSGTTLTFNSPIPTGTGKVFVKIGTTIAIGTPGSGTVTDASVAPNAGIQSSKLSFRSLYGAPQSRTIQSKLSDVISVKDYGAKGDGTTDDTTAVQAAVAAVPNGGTLYFPQGFYLLSDEVRLTHPIWIRGAGTGSATAGITGGSSDAVATCIQQTNTAKSIFKMVASLGNYAFGQYGILDIKFSDIHLEGNAIGARSVSAITTDTTVNGGDYHIRHIDFDNVLVRFFQKGVDFTGINYLNTFVSCKFYWCDYGFWSAKGAASDTGGQTRFFGCTFDQCGTCASLAEDSTAGSFGFVGCTLSESQYGIRTTSDVVLSVTGECEFETLTTGSGIGAAIYIKVNTVPSDASRYICGNKFLTSDNDIWIDKTSTSSVDGNFSFPTVIDGNTLLSAKSLTVSVPVGHLPISGKNFVLGAANAGLNAGFLQDSQISTNYQGLDLRKFTFKRRFPFTNTTLGANFITVPQGAVIVKARVYFAANATVSTGFSIGDGDNGTRYLNAQNAQTATLNQWYGWQDLTGPQPIVNTPGMTALQTSFTAGPSGAAGVVEVEYYVP